MCWLEAECGGSREWPDMAIDRTFPKIDEVIVDDGSVRSKTLSAQHMSTWQAVLRNVEKATETDCVAREETFALLANGMVEEWL